MTGVTFATLPLESDTEITGPVAARRPRPAGVTVIVTSAWSTARCWPMLSASHAAATSSAPISGVSGDTSVASASWDSISAIFARRLSVRVRNWDRVIRSSS